LKRTVLYSFIFSLALMTLPFGHTTLASGKRMRHTIVAVSGSPAPAGGNYLFFLNARLSPRPEVVFDAFLGGPSHTGVFLGRGRTTSAIALGGNPDPAAGNFGFVGNPFITRNGNVVFEDNVTSIFTSNKREFVRLVQDGDPAPGGGTMTPLAHATNDHGAIAYLARVSDSPATQGIFRTDGTGTVAIARDDIGAPTGGSFTFLFEPIINNRGQVAFGAELSGGAADYGIFRGDGGSLVPVFVANQIAPGGGTFTDFGIPVLNAPGQIAALGLLTDSASSIGLFLGDGTSAVAIALEGQSAPKGGNYGSRIPFPGAFRLNDRGEVAFHARLVGGTSTEGIFRGDGERTTTVALAGSIAPGTNGTFAQFHDIKLRNSGRVAFIATLAVGVGGVDFSNNMGIWIGTSEKDLRLVVRTGEIIDGNVLTTLPTDDGGRNQFDMNENAVVWIGSFQSPIRAVVLSQILGENDEP
jgi:hypothetical protein